MDAARRASIGRAMEAFVVWSRVLDSHRTVPFGDLQLSRSQVEVLFLVAHSDPPVGPGRLSRELGVTPGAVTQLVAGLVSAGLVEHRSDPDDARRRLLVLSDASRKKVAAFEREVVRQLAPRFAALDDQELSTLAELLTRTRGA